MVFRERKWRLFSSALFSPMPRTWCISWYMSRYSTVSGVELTEVMMNPASYASLSPAAEYAQRVADGSGRWQWRDVRREHVSITSRSSWSVVAANIAPMKKPSGMRMR